MCGKKRRRRRMFPLACYGIPAKILKQNQAEVQVHSVTAVIVRHCPLHMQGG